MTILGVGCSEVTDRTGRGSTFGRGRDARRERSAHRPRCQASLYSVSPNRATDAVGSVAGRAIGRVREYHSANCVYDCQAVIVTRFEDSYLGGLRRHVGHALLLSPGVQIVLERSDGQVLVQRRADNGHWEIPAGSCEPGQSFVAAALAELVEETGIRLGADELEPFATLSDPVLHTLLYPNGDRVQAFALCFLAKSSAAAPTSGDGEASEWRWVSPASLPEPVHAPTRIVLQLLSTYRSSGTFQAK